MRAGPLASAITHMDLLRNLTLKDFRLRYRNSALGFLWSLLNPLAMMVVLTIFYSVLFPSSVPDYPLFVLPSLLAWRFFAVGTSTSVESIAGNTSLVTKVYLPRWLLVLASNLANMLGASVEFIALFPLMVVLGAKLTFLIALLPVVLVLELLLILGFSLILASLNVYSRDFGQIWEIFLQAAFFLSPIFYSQNVVPQKYQIIYSVNPIARIVETIRKILYSGVAPTPFDILIVAGAAVIMIVLGALVFNRLESGFGELV